MDEAFLPWWVVVLLGMWSISLTVWQHPSVHREVRLWAGLLSLVYMALIFLALGMGLRTSISAPNQLTRILLSYLGLGLCGLLSLSASVLLLARISRSSRQLCYVVVTLANAGLCAILQRGVISSGLLIVAAIAATPLFVKGTSRLPKQKLWSELLQFDVNSAAMEQPGKSWLTGGLTMLLACVFLGTSAYALRYEVSRENGTSRITVLPARAQVDALLFSGNAATAEPSLLNYIAATRADIVVLMAAIVFLALASSRSQRESSEITQPAMSNDDAAAPEQARHP